MRLASKDLLGMEYLSVEEIDLVLNTAEAFKEISIREVKKAPTLRGKTIITLFYEPSTRTRVSFEIAAKRLSADALNISTSASSVVKGETLIDTARNLEAMNPDIVILRHSAAGAPHTLARLIRPSIINAGDGAHEHPSQALLDLMTIRDKKGKIAGLKVAVVGDIAHSRVARSNIYGLTKMGARVAVAGPAMMMPRDLHKLGVEVYYSLGEAIKDADIIMMLRVQFEREERKTFPSIREYAACFGLNRHNIKLAREDVLVMHPGPVNRGVEISPDIVDGPYSIILDQVTNGVAVRMALLYLLAGGKHETAS